MTATKVAIYLMEVTESRTRNKQVQVVSRSVALQNPMKLTTKLDHILRNRLLMRTGWKNITRRGKGQKKITLLAEPPSLSSRVEENRRELQNRLNGVVAVGTWYVQYMFVFGEFCNKESFPWSKQGKVQYMLSYFRCKCGHCRIRHLQNAKESGTGGMYKVFSKRGSSSRSCNTATLHNFTPRVQRPLLE